jgi:hypothetical protein
MVPQAGFKLLFIKQRSGIGLAVSSINPTKSGIKLTLIYLFISHLELFRG